MTIAEELRTMAFRLTRRADELAGAGEGADWAKCAAVAGCMDGEASHLRELALLLDKLPHRGQERPGTPTERPSDKVSGGSPLSVGVTGLSRRVIRAVVPAPRPGQKPRRKAA